GRLLSCKVHFRNLNSTVVLKFSIDPPGDIWVKSDAGRGYPRAGASDRALHGVFGRGRHKVGILPRTLYQGMACAVPFERHEPVGFSRWAQPVCPTAIAERS